MLEKIEVLYKYTGIDSADPENHIPYYHKYIVYTDSNGVQHAARGGTTIYEEGFGAVGLFKPMGAIVTQYGLYDSSFIDYPKIGDGPRPSEVIATGTDLSAAWQSITDTMDAINGENFAYLPDRNSNSVVDTALQLAGLSQPTLDENGDYLSPGSGNILPASNPDSPAHALPGPICTDIQPCFNSAISASSPLVIDLSSAHTGVTLTTWNASTTETFFDLNTNGFAVQTAWVTGDTGLLARDLNSNGTIDSSAELFGSPTVDGFAKLAALDSNHDLRIDNNDADWSTLVVWTDDNGDAVTQSGELHSLASLGIANIDLAGVASSTSTISGNPISHTSTVTFTGGATATIADAWFVHDNTNSYYAGGYTLDAETLFLPALRGYGTLPDLTMAMSQDSDLKELVADFVSGFSLTDLADADGEITDILYKWAGTDGISPAARGYNIDARSLGFLEQMLGTEFIQTRYNSGNPGHDAAAYLEEAYQTAYNMFSSALLVQAGLGSLFDTPLTYNPTTGMLSGGLSLSHDAIDDLASVAPATGPENEAFWNALISVLDNIKGIDNLTVDETDWLDDAITASNALLDWTDVLAAYYNDPGTSSANGTSGADTLSGGNAEDTIHGLGGNDTIHGSNGNDMLYGDDDDDIIYGDAGHDYIAGGAGNDELYGGDGNDQLTGGYGDDTYYAGAGGNWIDSRTGDDTFVYGGGDDVITEYGGTDKIVLPSGVVLGDLTFSRVSSDNSSLYFDDLLIQIEGSGSIQIRGHFYTGGACAVETIEFSDTSTLSLTSLAPDVRLTDSNDNFSASTNASYSIYGFDGNDTIWMNGTGAHTFDGGNGNDILRGGTSSNDTYIASTGFDEIQENNGTDTIVVPVGFTVDDVTFYRVLDVLGPTNDLGISINGLGEISISSHFTSASKAVESMHFLDDNTTISLTNMTITTVGTSGNDTLSPPNTNASANDIFDGREGNDTLNGGAGNDTYIFSAGHDTIKETSGYAGDETIRVRDSYGPSDISMYFDDSNSLQIFDSSGNNLTVYRQGYAASYSVEHIAFGEGTTWNLGSLEIETHGTSGNDTLNGSNYGDASNVDTIYGYAGADYLYGSDGADTLYGGDGNDNLRGEAGNDIIYGGDGDDYIFASGSNGDDTAHGDAGADTLYGVGHSVLYGDDGDDELHNNASSTNAATTLVALNGGSGADDLYGGYGQTIMDGGSDADTLNGVGGSTDTFKFSSDSFGSVDTVKQFKISSDHDKLDISDILDGHYNPGTDVITNFVQITTNGSNSELFVDTTGTATFGAAQHIATIQGVTGLTDEEALLTAGTLLAA